MKTVLITGATSGIGRATAILFAENGFKVIVNGRNEERGNAVAKETGGTFIKADISDQEEVKKLFSQIKSLDVLVNNAGGVTDGDDFYKASDEAIERSFRTNFYSAFYCSREVVKIMQTGTIVNVGSIYGLNSNPGPESETVLIYSSAKAAVHALSQNLSKLLAPKIRVNTVAPGWTRTPGWGSDFTDKKEKEMSEKTWVKRFNLPEEVASVIYLLATNKAMTGSQVVIDGGLVLK